MAEVNVPPRYLQHARPTGYPAAPCRRSRASSRAAYQVPAGAPQGQFGVRRTTPKIPPTIWRACCGCLLSVVFCAHVILAGERGDKSEPSAATILARIQQEGAPAVLWSLWNQEKPFQLMLNGISRGNAEWLKVARLLRPVSDAGASLSLDTAVSEALPHAPSRVLPLLSAGIFKIEDVCRSSTWVDTPGPMESAHLAAIELHSSHSLRAGSRVRNASA